MTTQIAEKAPMTTSAATDRATTGAALVAAAVEDYQQLLTAPQRERLLAVCLDALSDGTPYVERLAGDLLAALCPDVPAGVRDTLAWICGDVAGR